MLKIQVLKMSEIQFATLRVQRERRITIPHTICQALGIKEGDLIIVTFEKIKHRG